MAAPLLRRLCNLVVPTTSYPSMYDQSPSTDATIALELAGAITL